MKALEKAWLDWIAAAAAIPPGTRLATRVTRQQWVNWLLANHGQPKS